MSGRIAYWVVFTAAMAVYVTMLAWTLPAITHGASGLVPFDMRPTGYTTAEAREFLAALTPEARALYLGPQQTLDLFYPALLSLVLIGAIRTLVSHRVAVILLVTAVLIGTAGDYAENYYVASLLTTDGPVPDNLVSSANSATLVKSVMTSIGMIAVLAGLGRFIWKKWADR